MTESILAAILLIALVGLLVFLYNHGFMVLKATRALTFVGSPRGNSASFHSCSGYIKRIIRFDADGIYTFVLDAQLSKGEMWVELLDESKQKIMQLDALNRGASVSVEKKKKYCLVLNFKSATGRYTLNRQ